MPCTTTNRPENAATLLPEGHGPVVVVPIFNAYDDVVQCVHALLRHTADDTPILLVDDGSTDARLDALLGRLETATHPVVAYRRSRNEGFVKSMNDAFAVCGRHDVVLVNSDVIVAAEWLTRLRAAAYADSRIATATPLTNNGTILSVPRRNQPSELPPDLTVDEVAQRIAEASAQIRPRLPTCVGHCTYFKRQALDLVGSFDEAFSPGYGEEVDFSQRCVLVGLAHVCADDVFVYHRGGASFGHDPGIMALRKGHEATLAARYPYYHGWVGSVADGRLPAVGAAVVRARRALEGLTVTLDGTVAGAHASGTQRVAVGTIRALAAHPRIGRLTVVTADPVPQSLRDALGDCPTVQLQSEGSEPSDEADVVYRPAQIWLPSELQRLRRWGDRLVFTQLDFIAYDNPSYFPNWYVWASYRDATRLAFANADGVAFLSSHSEREARDEGLLPPGTPTAVTYGGTDHFESGVTPVPPPGLPPECERRGFVLCLGADYRHKNRLFALRVFDVMRARGYEGSLVFAGPRMSWGSSRADEADFLVGRPGLAAAVVTLPEVSEAGRAWLYRHAALVLYPTLYEGFGLIPLEAGTAGAPCLSSLQGSLAEVMPDGIPVIADWEPDVVATQAVALATDRDRGRATAEVLARRAREFTWSRVADRLVGLFETACEAPLRPRVTAVRGETSATVGTAPPPDPYANGVAALYPPEFHEAMRAIGQRPSLYRPVVGVTTFAYRLASRFRTRVVRGRGGQEDEPR